MNYTQLTSEKKAQIDILLEQRLSMRKVAEILKISHSTISRYKANVYKKREIDITKKYDTFLQYLYSHYNYKTCSIEICVMKFKKNYLNANCPTTQQVYNWINEEKIKYEISERNKPYTGIVNINFFNIMESLIRVILISGIELNKNNKVKFYEYLYALPSIEANVQKINKKLILYSKEVYNIRTIIKIDQIIVAKPAGGPNLTNNPYAKASQQEAEEF